MTTRAKRRPRTIRQFYAVTMTSVYHVQAISRFVASAVKIALHGSSEIPVRVDLCRGGMIAICGHLQAYVPLSGDVTDKTCSYERRLESVTPLYWRTSTSEIVGLFRSLEEALACFQASMLQPCDPRWLDITRQVLVDIGDEHPSFYVSHHPKLGLLEQLNTGSSVDNPR